MTDLIDTTEMYLRTVLELEEEGVVPLRARIAERLHQSGPTVSQTVARMERDGLMTVQGDRHLELTDLGRNRAVAVMRKHRLAELLLVNVIGLEYESAHTEACRWEHVMSEEVERRVYELLGRPTRSPYGNEIPGLAALGGGSDDSGAADGAAVEEAVFTTLATVQHARPVVVHRISEQLQNDVELIHLLFDAGVHPGAEVTVRRQAGGVTVSHDGVSVDIPRRVAGLVFVSAG